MCTQCAVGIEGEAKRINGVGSRIIKHYDGTKTYRYIDSCTILKQPQYFALFADAVN